MLRENRRGIFIAAAVILAAVLVRLYNIDGALFDLNPLRQALNAFVARNYALTSGAMFLLPQADNMGSSPGYLMFELPVLPYLASLLIRFFGVQDWIFRAIPIVLFCLSGVYFYRIALLMTGKRESLLALAFYLFVPMSILMSRVFQAEAFMMLAMLFAVYHFLKWIESELPWHLAAATVGLTLLVLLKITNLYIFIFLAAVFFIYDRRRLMGHFAFPAVIALFAGVLWWIIYPADIRAMFPNEYTMAAGKQVFGVKHMAAMLREYTFSPSYWLMTVKQCAWIVFSPVVFILMIGGIFTGWQRRSHSLLLTWLIAALIFIAAVPGAALQDYYKLHFVPAGAILAAVFYFRLYDLIASSGGPKRLFASLVAVITAVTIFAAVYPVIRYKPIFQAEEALGGKVQDITLKDDLVIASFGPDAMLLFYCGRKGWSQYLASGEDNIKIIEERRKQGARYFVSGNLRELAKAPALERYLMKRYRLLVKEWPRYGEPEGFSLEHAVWVLLWGVDAEWASSLRQKIGAKSLGYAIFDLKERGQDAE